MPSTMLLCVRGVKAPNNMTVAKSLKIYPKRAKQMGNNNRHMCTAALCAPGITLGCYMNYRIRVGNNEEVTHIFNR